MKEIYVVQEVDSNGNVVTQLFNEDRKSAIDFLKTRHAIIKQSYKDWREEVGINYYKWQKDENYVELYLKILEDNNTNDRKESV